MAVKQGWDNGRGTKDGVSKGRYGEDGVDVRGGGGDWDGGVLCLAAVVEGCAGEGRVCECCL